MCMAVALDHLFSSMIRETVHGFETSFVLDFDINHTMVIVISGVNA